MLEGTAAYGGHLCWRRYYQRDCRLGRTHKWATVLPVTVTSTSSHCLYFDPETSCSHVLLGGCERVAVWVLGCDRAKPKQCHRLVIESKSTLSSSAIWSHIKTLLLDGALLFSMSLWRFLDLVVSTVLFQFAQCL